MQLLHIQINKQTGCILTYQCPQSVIRNAKKHGHILPLALEEGEEDKG